MKNNDNRVQERMRRALQCVSDERGDVPGWVLVTLMTAGLVAAVWLIADGQLTSILTRALNNVAAL